MVVRDFPLPPLLAAGLIQTHPAVAAGPKTLFWV